MDSPARIRALATVNEIRHVLASPIVLDSQGLEHLRDLLALATEQIRVITVAKPRRYGERTT